MRSLGSGRLSSCLHQKEPSSEALYSSQTSLLEKKEGFPTRPGWGCARLASWDLKLLCLRAVLALSAWGLPRVTLSYVVQFTKHAEGCQRAEPPLMIVKKIVTHKDHRPPMADLHNGKIP